MSFSELSIKKLNQIVRAKAGQLPTDQANSLLQQHAQVYEKSGLLSLCGEFIDPSEIERLLQPVATASTTTPTTSSPSSNSSGSGSQPMGAQQMADMSPEQLTKQARAMRSNPSAFCAMQSPPLSLEQVMQAASQMEQMAANPAMLQQMKTQLAGMSPDDLEKLRHQQQQPPARSLSAEDAEDERLLAVLRDPSQARTLLRQQPGFSSLSDEVLDQQLDTIRNVDPAMLKSALGWMRALARVYKRVDEATGGRGRVVVGGCVLVMVLLGLFMGYLLWGLLWAGWARVFGAASSVSDSGAADSAPAGAVNDVVTGGGTTLLGHDEGEDEFEF